VTKNAEHPALFAQGVSVSMEVEIKVVGRGRPSVAGLTFIYVHRAYLRLT
jgi:hypothetical protein